MNQREYLEHKAGTAPGFSKLIDDVVPQMEVRVFLKEGVREAKGKNEEERAYALTRLKLILYAWKYDTDHHTVMEEGMDAHVSNSIAQTLRSCFFSQGWAMELFYLLQNGGMITPDIDTLAEEMAVDILKFGERDGNNRAFFYGLAHAYGAINFPGNPKSGLWRKYAEAVFDDWYAAGDCFEPGYVAHNISWVIKLGLLLGKEKELKSERAIKIFERYLDHVSPSGLVIAPGDGDDQSSYLDAFESMYQVTGDKRFLWAFEKASAAGCYGGYRGKQEKRKIPENQVICTGIMPRRDCTQIQYLYPDTIKIKDRLLLNPSRETGSPYMAMMINDHYDTLHHESEDNRGEIYHYESEGVLCLKRSSWYKWAEQTNTVVIKDALEEFPFVYSEGLHKDHWYHASADLTLMEHFLPDERYEMYLEPLENYRHFERARKIVHNYDMPLPLQYRDRESPYGIFLSNPRGREGTNRNLNLDSIALSIHTFTEKYWKEGKDRFDVAMTWNRDEHRNLVYSDREPVLEICNLYIAGPAGKLFFHEEYELSGLLQAIWYPIGGGQRLLSGEELSETIQIVRKGKKEVFRIHCPYGRLDLFFKGFHRSVRMTEEYTKIGFDYRYLTDVRNYLRTPIKLLVNRITTRSLHVDHQQGGVLKSSLISSKGEDRYGEVFYEGVYTYDTAWKRKTLLTKEGYLIVVDEIDPGKDAAGMAGGPVWQMPRSPVMGLHWADSLVEKDKQKNLMIYFHPQRGHRYGIQCQPKIWVDREYAFYDRAILYPERKEMFVSVFILHDSVLDPIELSGKHNIGGCLEPSCEKKQGGIVMTDENKEGIITYIGKKYNVSVQFNHPKLSKMKIQIHQDGGWYVER